MPPCSLARCLLTIALVVTCAACGESDGSQGGAAPQTVPDLADLTITSATVQKVSDQSCFGFETCLIVTVANRGTVDATGLDDGCGTSSFGDPEPWSSFVIDGSVPAETTVTFRSGYSNLTQFLPATFKLFCEIDAADRIAEIDETNNIYVTTMSL